MHILLLGLSTYGLNGLGKGDERHPAPAPFGVLRHLYLYLLYFVILAICSFIPMALGPLTQPTRGQGSEGSLGKLTVLSRPPRSWL